jgi:GBP family porin
VTLPGGVVAGKPSTRLYSLDSGVGYGSRLGFRGTEDLGDGWRALFLMEMGIAADTGGQNQGGLAFGRQIYVGLGGTNWTVTAGRHYSLMNVAVALSEAMVGSWWGNITGAAMGNSESAGSTAGNGSFQLNTRVDNSVYLTGKTGPVTGNLMVGAGNENSRGTGRSAQGSVVYETGGLRATAAFAKLRQNAEQIIPSAKPEWLTQWTVGANYDFGVVKLYGGYFAGTGPNNVANLAPVAVFTSATPSPFATAWDKNRLYWIGARVPIGVSAFTFNIGREIYSNRAAPEGHSTTLALLYEYFLSKRTELYANYGQVNNDSGARTVLYSAVPAVIPSGFGSDPKALSVGMIHRF